MVSGSSGYYAAFLVSDESFVATTSVAEAIVQKVAAEALQLLIGSLVLGNRARRDFAPLLARELDTVDLQGAKWGRLQIVLNHHPEVVFEVPDITKMLAVPELLFEVYLRPACIGIAGEIDSKLSALHAADDDRVLVTRRLPMPLPGSGSVACYAETADFGIKVEMSYSPKTLAQKFAVEVLYGCGSAKRPHDA